MQWISTLILVLASAHATAQLLPQQPQKRLVAGVVNGDTVWLDEYSREVGRLTEYSSQRGAVDPSDKVLDVAQEQGRVYRGCLHWPP